MTKRNVLITVISVTIFSAISYYVSTTILEQDFSIWIIGTGFVLGLVYALAVVTFLNFKKEKKELGRYKKLESEYKLSRLSNQDLLEKLLPELFRDKEKVNVVVTSNYQNKMTKHIIVAGLVGSQLIEPRKIQGETERIFSNLETYVDMSLPTYVFIQIGKDCFGYGIQTVLRGLKRNYPKVEIYVMCSNFYWDHKSRGIEQLIHEGTVNKQKIADSVGLLFLGEKMIAVISQSLKN
ncbi:MAG: hypothetical protein WCG55_00795 [bacterium]